MCKVYTGNHGTSKTEHGLCARMIDNFLTKARGLSLRTGAQTMLYLSPVVQAYLQFMAKTVKWSSELVKFLEEILKVVCYDGTQKRKQ